MLLSKGKKQVFLSHCPNVNSTTLLDACESLCTIISDSGLNDHGVALSEDFIGGHIYDEIVESVAFVVLTDDDGSGLRKLSSMRHSREIRHAIDYGIPIYVLHGYDKHKGSLKISKAMITTNNGSFDTICSVPGTAGEIGEDLKKSDMDGWKLVPDVITTPQKTILTNESNLPLLLIQ